MGNKMAKQTPTKPTPTPKTPSNILPSYPSSAIQTFYPANLLKSLKALVIPVALRNDPSLDSAIFELLSISIEAHFELSGTPFANPKNIYKMQDFFLSNFSIMYAQNTTPSIALEDLVEKKVGGQKIFKFEILENVFNFLFSTIQDQILLVQKLDASHLHRNMDAHSVIQLFQIRMASFYSTFPSMKKVYDNAYLTTIIIGLYLLNIAQKNLGTFKDAIFATLPKTLSRSETEYVEKTAINTILNTIKSDVQETVSLDPINVYRDLQAIYDCSLSFLPFHVIAQKFQGVKNRLENTKFLQDQISTLLDQDTFVEYLTRLKVVQIKQQPQTQPVMGNTPVAVTVDQIEITKSLIFLEIMCIDAFVQDQDFYAKIYDKQGLWQVLKAIPRLKTIDFDTNASTFLKVYRAELDTWNYYAWNTDGSVRNAKNLVLKPVGPAPKRSQLQLSSAALVLDPLLKETVAEFDAGLSVFKGRTFYDIYKAFRSSVFVTSYYFDVTAYQYFERYFTTKSGSSMPLQGIYLFLVYCQYRIKDYAMKTATLFEKTDVLESPTYSTTKDVARKARYDAVYTPIIKTTIAMSMIIWIDKIVTKDRRKYRAKKS